MIKDKKLFQQLPDLARQLNKLPPQNITPEITPERYNNIEQIAKKLNLKIIPDNSVDFLTKTTVLPLLDEESGLRVDFIFSFSEYEKQALKRVNKIKIDDTKLCYASVLKILKQFLLNNKNVDEERILKCLSEFEKVLNEKLIERFKSIKRGLK